MHCSFSDLPTNPGLVVVCCRDTRRRAFKINALNRIPNPARLIDQVAKVLPRDLGLHSDLLGLFALRAELLDAALEADTEVVSWETEDFTNGRGDAVAVGVHVVDCCELGGDFGR